MCNFEGFLKRLIRFPYINHTNHANIKHLECVFHVTMKTKLRQKNGRKWLVLETPIVEEKSEGLQKLFFKAV